MPADLTARIAEIAGRAEAAPGGPWFVWNYDTEDSSWITRVPNLPENHHRYEYGGTSDHYPKNDADEVIGSSEWIRASRATADFVAAARTDIPALLRLVAVLREQRDKWYSEAYRLGSGKSFKTSIDRQDHAALLALDGEVRDA